MADNIKNPVPLQVALDAITSEISAIEGMIAYHREAQGRHLEAAERLRAAQLALFNRYDTLTAQADPATFARQVAARKEASENPAHLPPYPCTSCGRDRRMVDGGDFATYDKLCMDCDNVERD